MPSLETYGGTGSRSIAAGAHSEEARRRWEARNAELDAAAAEQRRKEAAERDLQQVRPG